MTDYGPITDPSNPFATAGLSHEVRAQLDYLLSAKEAGLDVVATSTTDHAVNTTSGNRSRHRMAGTDGEGLAIDCRLRKRGNDIHRAVFDIFVPVETKLHELIYAKAPYNIKAGKRVAPYAVASHHDHVHVSVTLGTMLRWPGTRPTPVATQPPVDYPEDKMRSHAKKIPLGDHGTGWIELPVPAAKVCSITVNGMNIEGRADTGRAIVCDHLAWGTGSRIVARASKPGRGDIDVTVWEVTG